VIRRVFLLPGEWAVEEDPVVLMTVLGSCVSVAVYDRMAKRLGLNHFLLADPMGRVVHSEKERGRYGCFAIDMLIQEMLRRGSRKGSLQARIFGGANILNDVEIGQKVGLANIDLARELLRRHQIAVISEDIGGQSSRKIALRSEDFLLCDGLGRAERVA